MPEITQCPGCQRKLQVPETLLGQQVQCPTCGAMFTASLDADAPPPLPPRSEAMPPRERDDYGGDEGPRRRRRYDDRGGQYDDYDDYDDYDRPRRRRRDLMPHRGSTILALGIISFFCFGPILGPIAWIMGN